MDMLPTQGQPNGERERDREDNKDLAAFSYLWIMSVIVFLAKRQSPFVRFHARQGIVLFLLSIAFYFIPILGSLLEIVVLAGMVFGFLAAAQGQWKDVPFVGPLSRGEASLRGTWRSLVAFVANLFHARKATSNPNPNPNPQSDSPSSSTTPQS